MTHTEWIAKAQLALSKYYAWHKRDTACMCVACITARELVTELEDESKKQCVSTTKTI